MKASDSCKIQVLKAGTSVGANYKESGISKGVLLEELLVEADELVAIFTTIGKKSKQ
jgi:hypothetical protein